MSHFLLGHNRLSNRKRSRKGKLWIAVDTMHFKLRRSLEHLVMGTDIDKVISQEDISVSKSSFEEIV